MFEFVFVTILFSLLILSKLAQRRNHTTCFGAPFVPLEPDVVDRIMNLSRIGRGDIYFDLGSGDGRLVIAAALRGAKAYGVEIDPFRVWYSRLCIFLLGLGGRAKIIHKNIFEIDLSKADAVTTYLLQETNDKLFEKLDKELKPRARVVSAAFSFSKWNPEIIDPNGPIYGPLYLYHLDQQKGKKLSDE